MTIFWRLFLSLTIAIPLIFLTTAAYSSPISPTLITQIKPNSFFDLGVIKMRRGDYQQAIDNFDQAIQLREDFALAYANRCLAYFQLQDYHEAIADCTQAINFAPDNFEAYLNRGLAHYREGDYTSAIADYHQALTLKPYDFRARYDLGLALAGERNYSEAILNFNLTLTQIPQATNFLLADIYNDRGLVHLLLQNATAATLDFNLAIRLNDNDYRAYFNRGCAYGIVGNNIGAIRDFSEVIKLKPTYAQAYVNRGIARYHLGYHLGAIADLKTATEYFETQGQKLPYEKALYLLKALRREIISTTEIAFFFNAKVRIY